MAPRWHVLCTCTPPAGECEDVMFVGLSTCPWYQSTQPERGQQAKHNCLVVIFRDRLRHVFSPANAHLRQEREVLDLVRWGVLICFSFIMPPHYVFGLSVRPSVRPKPEIPSFDLYMGPLVHPTNRNRFTACPSVRPSVCPSVRPERFPGICGRMHGGIGLKFYMLMYLDHLQKWLIYGYGLLIFSCDQAALQMVFSVCLSVCPSVCPSHLFDYVPIIGSSWNFQELLPMTNVRSMQKVKVRGQRSRSQRSQPNLTVSGL